MMVVTGVLARIMYNSGISFTVDPNRCIIEERVDGEFKLSYEAHNCARQYAEILEHIPYTAFGLNWDIQMPKKKTEQLVKKTDFCAIRNGQTLWNRQL